MNPTHFTPHFQRGNALFIILIAIALLASLTIVLTRSDVTDSDSVAPERARIMASQIMGQARNLEQTVKTMISRGCSEQQINFANPVVSGYTNPSAPADKSCDLFQSAGGGLTWPRPIANGNDGSDWIFLGNNSVGGVTLTDDGSCSAGCIDLIAALPNVTLDVCKQLNALAGVTSAATTPPTDAGNFDGTTKITTFSTTNVGEIILDAGNVLLGKPTGCFHPTQVSGAAAGADIYWFYHTLVIR